MEKQKRLQNAVIEQFMEKTEADASQKLKALADDGKLRERVRRFMKMVESRKKHILDKILLD
jgi:riboflavin synthase